MWINGNIEEEPEVGKVEKGLGTFIDSGTESQVYRSEKDPTKVVKAIKVNDPLNKNLTIFDFIKNRINNHNDFAETVPYKLIGFGKRSGSIRQLSHCS